MSCHFFAVFVKMKDSRCAEEFVSAPPILTGRIRTLDILGSFGQDQDQDSLLVKRRNDNHSPGQKISAIFNPDYLASGNVTK